MAKRTAKELWDALDEATLDAEIESAIAMTPEERRQALIKDGYDIDALPADADAFFASLPEKVASAASPIAPPPKEYAAWLRDAAQLDCDKKRFALCLQRLDEARRADGAGEGEPRVVKMREAIEAGLAPGSGDAH